MKLIKENEKGKTYQADGFKILYRKQGTITGDNENNPEEIIYLTEGKAKFQLNDKYWEETAPAKVTFPKKNYHKIVAITDITMIVFEM